MKKLVFICNDFDLAKNKEAFTKADNSTHLINIKTAIMKRLFMIVTTLLVSATLLGQENKVTGNVINKMTKRPIPGVTVTSKKASTITDTSGGFTINALPNEKLQLSHVGFNNLEVTVSGGSIPDIELEENENSMDMVVVTGYTKERRKDLTGS